MFRQIAALARRYPTGTVVAVGAVPVLILAALLACFAVNVPFWDQWELVPYIQKMQAGALQPIDLFDQHNEHRILFPRMIMLGLAWLTHWNTLYEVVVSVVTAGITLIFLWKIIRKTLKRPFLRVAALAIVSFILFSPAQFENWLWGWQMQWFLNALGLVVTVWALDVWQAKPWQRIVVAAIAAIVATYSLASGIFVWPVCLVLIWHDKRLRAYTAAWILLAMAVVSLYYWGYHDPAGHPSKLLFLQQPVQFVAYVATYIALPLAPFVQIALPVALVYAASGAVLVRQAWRRFGNRFVVELLPWACIGFYGGLAAISTAVARLGFGVDQAYSSRYETLSILVLFAFIMTAIKVVERVREPRDVLFKLASAMIVAVIVLAGASYAKGILQMHRRHNDLVQTRHCLDTARSDQDACLLLLYPNQAVVWPRLQYLRDIHWAGL